MCWCQTGFVTNNESISLWKIPSFPYSLLGKYQNFWSRRTVGINLEQLLHITHIFKNTVVFKSHKNDIYWFLTVDKTNKMNILVSSPLHCDSRSFLFRFRLKKTLFYVNWKCWIDFEMAARTTHFNGLKRYH